MKLLRYLPLLLLCCWASATWASGPLPGGYAPYWSTTTGDVNSQMNVRMFGAKCDGSTDDITALQTGINVASGWNGSSCPGIASAVAPSLIFPGVCKHSQPLHLSCGNINISATSGNESGTAPLGYYGPDWVVEPFGQENMTYGPQLIGTGYSIATTSPDVVFSEVIGPNGPAPSVNGSSALSVEVGFEATSTISTGGYSYIFTSRIAKPSLSAGSDGFATIKLNPFISGGIAKLQGCITLSGGAVCINNSSTPSLNTPHDVLLNYNGSNCQLFLDGTQVATTTCSGTVVQAPFEVAELPGLAQVWPFGQDTAELITGYVGPIKISKASAHTSNYTPATLTADSNTAMLENFSQSDPDGLISGVYGASGTAYMAIKANVEGSYPPSRVHMHDMYIGSWLEAIWSPSSEWNNITDMAGGQYGLFDFIVNDYLNHVHDNYTFVANGTGINYGAAFNNGIAANNYTGYATVAYMCNLCSLSDRNSYTTGGSGNMAYLYAAVNGNLELASPFSDVEEADANLLADIYLASSTAIITGGYLTSYGSVPFVIDTGGALGPIFNGTVFNTVSGTAAEVVDFTNAPNTQAVLQNINSPNSVPLSNDLQYVSTPGCGGAVTLSSGSGTLSQNCITSASICSGIDTTTFAHSFTLGAPSNGSVAISSGTGSDVIKVDCR